jgi:hypothetical protein
MLRCGSDLRLYEKNTHIEHGFIFEGGECDFMWGALISFFHSTQNIVVAHSPRARTVLHTTSIVCVCHQDNR